MRSRFFYILCLSVVLLNATSCKKESEETTTTVPVASLTAASTGGTIVATQMQSFLNTSIIAAADSGHTFYIPTPGDTTLKKLKSALLDYSWNGPDSQGWYWRYYSGEYTYSERLHLGDTIQYILDISSADGADSYDYKTTSKYIKKIKNGKTLYDGSCEWEENTFGYSVTSHWNSRIIFSDWNPSTSAGTFDWYWGISENSGGNTIPYHRFEHLEATEITDPEGWLHCKVIFYDDSGIETWQFEYDTPWAPVGMPEIPEWSK
jgi:hypothetical protein